MSSTLLLLTVASCALPGPKPSPTPPPKADVTATYGDDGGLFFLGLGQTLLIKLPSAGVHYPPVLQATREYADATLFKAVAVGRSTVSADMRVDCPNGECNVPAPMQITVVVVSMPELQQGVTVTELDWPFRIHIRGGQHLYVEVPNPAAGPAFSQITSGNPAVIVPDQPPTTSAGGIRGEFHGGEPGRTNLIVGGPTCSILGACPAESITTLSFVVFS